MLQIDCCCSLVPMLRQVSIPVHHLSHASVMVRCGACGSLLEVALHLPAEAPSEHLPTATSPSPRPPLAPAAQGLLAFHGGPGSGGSDLFFGEVSLSDLLTAGVDREGAPAPIMGQSSPGPNTMAQWPNTMLLRATMESVAFTAMQLLC
jgi:hypothetical protein